MNSEVTIKPVDALWSLIMSQPKKVREALSDRMLAEREASRARKKTLKAVDDARKGRGITRCNSFEEYLKAVAE